MVKGSRLGIWGPGFGLRIKDYLFMVRGSVSGVQAYEFRVSG